MTQANDHDDDEQPYIPVDVIRWILEHRRKRLSHIRHKPLPGAIANTTPKIKNETETTNDTD